MRKIATALILASLANLALAACPPHAPYGCTPMPNGKMLCGCGVR